MNITPLPDVDIVTLRAWADAGEISTARYVEEAERRRREQALAAQAVAFEALGEDVPEANGDLFHHPIE